MEFSGSVDPTNCRDIRQIQSYLSNLSLSCKLRRLGQEFSFNFCKKFICFILVSLKRMNVRAYRTRRFKDGCLRDPLLGTDELVPSGFPQTRMATRKAAESTLYHVHPKGFWKKFRASETHVSYCVVAHVGTGDAVVVNPEISSGLPIPELNRYPQPGSRPEKYSTPATKGAHEAIIRPRD